MTQVEPWPFDGPVIGEQLKSHPIGDEDEIAPWIVANFLFCEVEQPKHGGHKERIQYPSQYGGRSGVPYPPSGGCIPSKESQ